MFFVHAPRFARLASNYCMRSCDVQETFKSVGSLRMDFITPSWPNRQRGGAAGAQLI